MRLPGYGSVCAIGTVVMTVQRPGPRKGPSHAGVPDLGPGLWLDGSWPLRVRGHEVQYLLHVAALVVKVRVGIILCDPPYAEVLVPGRGPLRVFTQEDSYPRDLLGRGILVTNLMGISGRPPWDRGYRYPTWHANDYGGKRLGCSRQYRTLTGKPR
jgi:hypothetical protein